MPTLEAFLTTLSGDPGWTCTFFQSDADGKQIGGPVGDYVLRDSAIRLNDFLPPGLGATWMLRLNGKLTVDKTAEYNFGVAVAGRAKLYIDGTLVVDNWTRQQPGDFYYGSVLVLLGRTEL